MKITLVTPSLAAGGAERAVVLLSEGFRRRQHQVAIVSLSGSAADFFTPPSAVTRINLDLSATSRSVIAGLQNNLKRLRALRHTIKSTQPEIVISHSAQTNVLSALALARTRYPLVLVEHSDPNINTPQRIWKRLRRQAYPRANALVSVNRSISDYFAWLPEAKRVVIANPVVADFLVGQECNATPTGRYVVAMGRLIKLKGFDRLLAAFALLAPRHPDWKLLIMGEGPQRQELEEQIAALGLNERAQLAGFAAHPSSIFRQAEIFVMTSRSEGFPYALLEAMACGLPAVAMDCDSGPREIIRPGIDGLLVPDGDTGALAAALDQLIGNEAERRRLGARAPEVLERFGLEQIIDQWEALCSRIV